jgi:hypothetical protein
MGVPIQDGDAPGAMEGPGVAGRDRDVVEEAEAGGPRPAGVVSGRAHDRDGVADLSGHDLIDGLHGGPGAPQGRLQRAGSELRVAVPLREAPALKAAERGRDVPLVVRAMEGGMRDAGRLLTHERREALPLQAAFDGADPVGPLRMPRRRKVGQRGGVGEMQGRQASPPGWRASRSSTVSPRASAGRPGVRGVPRDLRVRRIPHRAKSD